MSQSTTEVTAVLTPTLGIDLGDRRSDFCLLADNDPVRRGSVATTPQAMAELFGSQERCLVVMEVCSQSPWVSRVAREAGHEVIVADPRRLALITRGVRKTDRKDAEWLARLARADRALLNPVRHRDESTQADLSVMRARRSLVESRTALVNHVRGAVKALGHRIKKCSATSFHRQAPAQIPAQLRPALEPVLKVLEQLSEQIRAYDQLLETIARTRYPQTALLEQVPGVGSLAALMYVLTLEDPRHFARSRQVGPYLGLTPRKRQSGDSDPQLRITKAGDREMRRLLVISANYILGRHGPDCDLRRWGLKIAERGAKNARKRAKVAVARRLAVLLHHLWLTGEVYDPHHLAKKRGELVSA